MISIILNIFPIFLLIFLGALVIFFQIATREQLAGLEKLTFYVFFPALLINTLYKVDFASLSASNTAFAFFFGIATMMVFGLLTRRLVERAINVSSPSYSSIFQGFTRWNAFIALAVAETLNDPLAITIVTIGIGVMAIPSNLVNVIVVTKLGSASLSQLKLTKLVLLNPIFLGVLFGLIISFSGIKLSVPIEKTLEMISQAALPIGLILVGTGLTLKLPRSAVVAASYATFVKLIAAPCVYFVYAVLFGVPQNEVLAIAISAAAPTAMNGYLIAKELGGDAPLYAAIATLQTVAAIFTTPMVIILVPELLALF